jgi:hypothetical protein
LTLIANGTLNIPAARASKAKGVILPRTINQFTGKESTRQTGFNDAAWGSATRSYAKSASKLPNNKFDEIIEGATEYMKVNRTRNKTTEATEVIEIDDDDERACLVSDDDGHSKDCRLPCYCFMMPLT